MQMPRAPALVRCCCGLWGHRRGRGWKTPCLRFSAEHEVVLNTGKCRGRQDLAPWALRQALSEDSEVVRGLFYIISLIPPPTYG